MRHLRWQLVIAILGLLLVSGLLVGKSQHALVVSDVPAAGGAYTEALIGTPHAFNPLLDSNNPVDRDVDRLLFSGLTQFDSVGRATPDLANWIISDDQLSYTFVLRADARWHDGQPVTAADVAFTVGLLQDPGYSGPADVAKLWQSVTYKIENRPDHQLYPARALRALSRLHHLWPAARAPAVGHQRRPTAQPAVQQRAGGHRPFSFVGLTGQAGEVTGVRLAAFAGFHGAKPLLNDVVFKFYPDETAALAAYKAGDVLGISHIDADHLDQALQLPQLGIYSSLMPQYSLIFLNLQNPDLPFFQDKRVRQALLRGLNRSGIVSQLLHGQAVLANSPILPGSWAYDAGLPVADYDPTGAGQLLDAAGWVIPNGASPGTTGYVRSKGNQPLSFALTVPE